MIASHLATIHQFIRKLSSRQFEYKMPSLFTKGM